MTRILSLPILCLVAGLALARGTYLTAAEFLDQAFDGSPPAPAVIWLTGERKERVQEILGHRYPSLRIRYWRKGERSAWILEETGKDQPITMGVVVERGQLERIRVLVFRESRGAEIRHPFFTRQFEGATLDKEIRLDRDIDGISGATLSVRAMKKIARLALYLDREVRKSDVEASS